MTGETMTNAQRGELAYQLTKRIVIDLPTARAAVDAAVAALAQPVAAEPFTYLVERSAFRVSPHGQDAESNEWLEEAKSDEPGAFPVYRHPPPTPA